MDDYFCVVVESGWLSWFALAWIFLTVHPEQQTLGFSFLTSLQWLLLTNLSVYLSVCTFEDVSQYSCKHSKHPAGAEDWIDIKESVEQKKEKKETHSGYIMRNEMKMDSKVKMLQTMKLKLETLE